MVFETEFVARVQTSTLTAAMKGGLEKFAQELGELVARYRDSLGLEFEQGIADTDTWQWVIDRSGIGPEPME